MAVIKISKTRSQAPYIANYLWRGKHTEIVSLQKLKDNKLKHIFVHPQDELQQLLI